MDVLADRFPDALDEVNAWRDRADRFFTPCGEGRMAWHAWGSGPLVVLMHGGAGSWRHWIRTLPALAGRYRVLAADLPGLGESDALPGPWSPQASAETTAAGLDGLVPAGETFTLVGFSAGAMIGGLVAARLKARCKGLIIVGAGSLGTERVAVQLEKVRSKHGEERWQAHRANLARLMIADPARIDDQALAIQEWNTQHARISSVGFSKAVLLREALATGPEDVKAIWGSLDAVALTSLAERCEVVRRLRPHADIRIIDGAGHWVMYEAAQAFNTILTDMLERAASPG